MNIKWTGVMELRLRHAWADGVPISLLAREFHCSRPAIIAQAARMGLPERNQRPPSHVTTQAEHAAALALALAGVKPLVIAAQTGLGTSVAYRIAQNNKPVPVLPPLALRPVQQAPRVAFAPPPRTAAVIPVTVRGSCQWPIGDPRSKAFRFCGANSMPDRPYCAEHCSVAYGRRAAE